MGDAGLLLQREVDERHLADLRTGRNLQFPLPGLFREFIGFFRVGGQPW